MKGRLKQGKGTTSVEGYQVAWKTRAGAMVPDDGKERRCLSHEGSGTHEATALSWPRRQRKHKATAVSHR